MRWLMGKYWIASADESGADKYKNMLTDWACQAMENIRAKKSEQKFFCVLDVINNRFKN